MGDGKLATLRYDSKRLTSLTLIPNIALNAVNFYSGCVLFNTGVFSARVMTLQLKNAIKRPKWHQNLIFCILKAYILHMHFSDERMVK